MYKDSFEKNTLLQGRRDKHNGDIFIDENTAKS